MELLLNFRQKERGGSEGAWIIVLLPFAPWPIRISSLCKAILSRTSLDFDRIPVDDELLGLTFRLVIALHHMRSRRDVPLAGQDVYSIFKHDTPLTEPSPGKTSCEEVAL